MTRDADQRSRLVPEILHYDRPTILLHWTTAVLVGLLWIIGQTIDYWPKGPLKVDFRSVHIVFGILLACVLATRVVWRLTRGLVLPPDRHQLLAFGAKVIQVALYLLIAVTIGLGVTTAWAQGVACSTSSPSHPSPLEIASWVTPSEAGMNWRQTRSWLSPACTPQRPCHTTICWATTFWCAWCRCCGGLVNRAIRSCLWISGNLPPARLSLRAWAEPHRLGAPRPKPR